MEGRKFTHIKTTIHPDGGIKRIRAIGRKVEGALTAPVIRSSTRRLLSLRERSLSPSKSDIMFVPVIPLTEEAYAPFGQVIQAYDASAAPSSVKITAANAGTADKFHKLSSVSSSYPSSSSATTAISVYRCRPLDDLEDGLTVLRTLERHPYTTQAFIPMGSPADQTADGYLVVVAHNGSDDKPDMRTLKAFRATTSQGISYNAGVWHQPMTVLGKVGLVSDALLDVADALAVGS